MNEPTREEWLAVPVDVLRAHFAGRADRSSVRAVADAVGVGRTTLHSFLAGESQPHRRIRRKLAIAYLKDTGQGETMRSGYIGSGVQDVAGGIEAALGNLVGHFPEEDRERVRRRLVDAMDEEFRLSGMDPPEWMDGL